MRRRQPPQPEGQVPQWVRSWRPEDWLDFTEPVPADCDGSPEGQLLWHLIRARRRWKNAGADWYRENGLPVPWGMNGYGENPEPLTRAEWKARQGG